MVFPPVEPISLSIGAVALASLFSTCLECFGMVELGRNFSRDLEILMTKLEAQRLIFSIWGNSVELDHNGEQFNSSILGPDVQQTISKLLNCIYMVFEDGEKLCKVYGLKPARLSKKENKELAKVSASIGSWSRFRFRIIFRQQHTEARTKVKWAIHDKNKFTVLISDLKDLIDQLKDITASVVDLSQQRKMLTDEISSISDIPSLELLEEALKEEDAELSDAASQRILQLTNGSICNETFLLSATTESIYVTAPSHHSNWGNAAENSAVEDEMEVEQGHSTSSAVTPEELSEPIFRAPEVAYGHRNNLCIVQQRDQEKVAQVISKHCHDYARLPLSVRRVFLQLRQISERPCAEESFVSLAPVNGDMSEVLGSIQGPPGTPYEGGVFFLQMIIPSDHPFMPPKCKFLTPIYHPNISPEGFIGVDILRNQWHPALTLENVLISICSLLGDPNFDFPFAPDLRDQYLEDPLAYEAQARILTQRYAQRNEPSPSELLVSFLEAYVEAFTFRSIKESII